MHIDNIINSNHPILLTGETGTGKSSRAKQIHRLSKRKIFRQVNIQGLNENLVESELFGHEKGAFSGASTSKVGFLEAVEDGTLFLDEIGELSMGVQAKLLNVLDEGLYYRVGSTVPRKFKGRFVYATHRNLPQEVSRKCFREDLYFRLRFCEELLPPLREELNIAEVIYEKARELGFGAGFHLNFSSGAIEALSNYPWPGNYRELQQTIQYLYCLDKKRVDKEDLPKWIKSNPGIYRGNDVWNYYEALSNFEFHYFKRCMHKFNGAINKTSEEIGLSKVTLISKLKKYDIDRRIYKEFRKEEKVHGL